MVLLILVLITLLVRQYLSLVVLGDRCNVSMVLLLPVELLETFVYHT